MSLCGIGWGLVFQGVRDFYHFKFIPGEPNFYHFKWFRACNFYRQTNTYPKISLQNFACASRARESGSEKVLRFL